MHPQLFFSLTANPFRAFPKGTSRIGFLPLPFLVWKRSGVDDNKELVSENDLTPVIGNMELVWISKTDLGTSHSYLQR